MNSIQIESAPTSTRNHRPFHAGLTALLAGAAVTVASVAIAPHRAGATPPPVVPRRAVVVEAPALWWADPARHPANQDPVRDPCHVVVAAMDATANPAPVDASTPWWAQRR